MTTVGAAGISSRPFGGTRRKRFREPREIAGVYSTYMIGKIDNLAWRRVMIMPQGDPSLVRPFGDTIGQAPSVPPTSRRRSPMTVIDEYLANNARYAESFSGPLPMPPSKHIAVVACMDARLNVYGLLGLND